MCAHDFRCRSVWFSHKTYIWLNVGCMSNQSGSGEFSPIYLNRIDEPASLINMILCLLYIWKRITMKWDLISTIYYILLLILKVVTNIIVKHYILNLNIRSTAFGLLLGILTIKSSSHIFTKKKMILKFCFLSFLLATSHYNIGG